MEKFHRLQLRDYLRDLQESDFQAVTFAVKNHPNVFSRAIDIEGIRGWADRILARMDARKAHIDQITADLVAA